MTTMNSSATDVGVIVGRFQVDDLTDGHHDLIRSVLDTHDRLILVVGLSPVRGSNRNPLPYQARKQMLEEHYPEATICYIKDIASDTYWSRKLDKLIDDLTTPGQTVTLYGSRDSFLKYYTGAHPMVEKEQQVFDSATKRRRQIQNQIDWNRETRAGAIYAAFDRYPTCYPTVDVAIFDDGYERLLLGKKQHDEGYRFIGGFVQPGSPSLEANARREVSEETGLAITDPVYVGSTLVDDWRYRTEVDKIMTTLFIAKVMYGRPEAADDIDEVKWFDFAMLRDEDLVPEHRPLLQMLRDHAQRTSAAGPGAEQAEVARTR